MEGCRKKKVLVKPFSMSRALENNKKKNRPVTYSLMVSFREEKKKVRV